jgi:hypothetical protein
VLSINKYQTIDAFLHPRNHITTTAHLINLVTATFCLSTAGILMARPTGGGFSGRGGGGATTTGLAVAK